MKRLNLVLFILSIASQLLFANGDLDAYSVTVNDTTPDPGDTVTVRWTAINRSGGNPFSNSVGSSNQGVMFSSDSTISRNDTLLEKEFLGPLLPGQTSPETRVVNIPSWAVPGRSYWIGIYADYDRQRTEDSESNSTPGTARIMDYNYLPYLEGEGLESNDPRMRDNTGDGNPDAGVTMNHSYCFSPGDEAYVNLDVELESDYTSLFNAKEDVQFSAWYNTSPTSDGRTEIGGMTLPVGDDIESLNLSWNLPHTIGDYYVFILAKVQIDGDWYTFKSEWIDPDNPIMVRDSLPVVLVHGWSDTEGVTFANLEILIETL